MASIRRFALPALIVACCFAYLMSNFTQFLLDSTGIPPYFTEVSAQIVIFFIVFVVYIVRRNKFGDIGGNFNILIFILFLMLFWTIVSYIYSSMTALVNQLLVQYIRAIIMLISLAVAIRISSAQRFVSYSAVGLAVMGALINFKDFVDPTFSAVPGRAAGFYENPNVSGAMLVYLGLIGSIWIGIVPTYVLWSVVSLGVALTFSRSAWIMLILALIGLAFQGRLGRGRGRIFFVAIISLIVAGIFFSLISGHLYYLVARSPLAEYLDPNTVARLGASGSLVDDYSSFERAGVLQAGWRAFLDAPILGHGLGFTREWDQPVSTHNMFVLFLAERGIIGCVLYLLLLGSMLIFSRGVARLLSIAVCIDAFFTHNQFDLMCEICTISVIIASVGEDENGIDARELRLSPSRYFGPR